MTTTYLVTGGNRGIGFSIVKHLSQDPNNQIIATARNITKATELAELANSNSQIHIVTLDVADQESIEVLDGQISKIADKIDVLISNAGVASDLGSALNTPRQAWIDIYTVNTVGPIMLVQQLHKFLAKSSVKQVIFISSLAGAFSLDKRLPVNAYGSSKAALNFANTLFHSELKDEGFTFVAIHPGLVLSDMGSDGLDEMAKFAPQAASQIRERSAITPEKSGGDIVKFLATIDKSHGGKFFRYDGEELDY